MTSALGKKKKTPNILAIMLITKVTEWKKASFKWHKRALHIIPFLRHGKHCINSVTLINVLQVPSLDFGNEVQNAPTRFHHLHQNQKSCVFYSDVSVLRSIMLSNNMLPFSSFSISTVACATKWSITATKTADLTLAEVTKKKLILC